jgi:hypothetical protein
MLKLPCGIENKANWNSAAAAVPGTERTKTVAFDNKGDNSSRSGKLKILHGYDCFPLPVGWE